MGPPRVGPREPSQAEVPPPPVAPGVRVRYVTKADVDQYGGTDFCPGCVSVTLYGTAKVTHNSACRERMGKLMSEDLSGRGRDRLEQHALKRGAAAEKEGEGIRPKKKGVPAEVSVEDFREDSVELEDAPVPEGDRRTPEEVALERVRVGKQSR